MNNSSIQNLTVFIIRGGGRCDFSSADSRFDAFVYILIAGLAIFENVTILVCYFRFRPLRSATNLCLISLTVSDIFVATLSIPFSFGVYLCKLRPEVDNRSIGDLIYLLCDMLPSNLSIYSLSLVAIDRLMAVTSPFFYAKHATHRSASISVILIWTFVTCLVFLITIIDKRDFTLFIVFMSYIFPVTIMVASYLVIGYVASRHAKEITRWEKTGFRLQKDSHCFSYNSSILPPPDDNIRQETDMTTDTSLVEMNYKINLDENREMASTRRFRYVWRELKASLRLLLLVGVFVVAWTPFMALNIEYYRCAKCYIDIGLVKHFKMLHYMNSALNPMLFMLLNKRWRTAFVMALCGTKMSGHASEAKINSQRDWS